MRVLPNRSPGRVRTVLRALAVPLLIAAVFTASAPGWLRIRVEPGDTLWAIAARYHTTVAALVALNHLPGNGDLIYAGSSLLVPVAGSGVRPGAGTGARSGSATSTVVRWVPYRVVVGDSLDAIAARYHANPAAIAAHNHLPASLVVELGQVLYIPQRVTVSVPAAGASRAGVPAAVGRAEVQATLVATARRYGLDPALVEAVAWQESGWQMNVVSATGAVGVMQVEPYTASYVSRYLVGRTLDIDQLQDNVTAGVALLATLTRVAPVGQAIAGYYQGLGSVRSRGMFASTRQYVADVLALRGRFGG